MVCWSRPANVFELTYIKALRLSNGYILVHDAELERHQAPWSYGANRFISAASTRFCGFVLCLLDQREDTACDPQAVTLAVKFHSSARLI